MAKTYTPLQILRRTPSVDLRAQLAAVLEQENRNPNVQPEPQLPQPDPAAFMRPPVEQPRPLSPFIQTSSPEMELCETDDFSDEDGEFNLEALETPPPPGRPDQPPPAPAKYKQKRPRPLRIPICLDEMTGSNTTDLFNFAETLCDLTTPTAPVARTRINRAAKIAKKRAAGAVSNALRTGYMEMLAEVVNELGVAPEYITDHTAACIRAETACAFAAAACEAAGLGLGL